MRIGTLVLLAASVAVAAKTYAGPDARSCDLDLIRSRAQQDYPRYRVVDVRAEGGIVTLGFRALEGTASFAIALHASGTRLWTSEVDAGLDAAESRRVSQPVTTWWRVSDVQDTLAACGESLPEASRGDLDSALHAAAQADLARRAGPGSGLHPVPRNVRINWWVQLGDVFFMLLAGGVVVGFWRSRSAVMNRDGSMLLALTALALLLRFVAHAGPSDVREVINEAGTRRAGWAALLHVIFSVLPRTDETIWTFNRIVGALSVPVLYAVMRRRFADRTAALAGAAALAVTPLIVRFSASDAPYIPLCAAWLGAIVAYDRWVESGSAGTLALALGLLTAALQLRPEGPWLIVPTTLLAVAGGVPADLRTRLRRPSVVVCALLFVAINALFASLAFSGNGHYLEGFVLVGSIFGSPWVDPNITPRMLGALVGLGASAALLYRYRRAGVLWLGAVLITFPLSYPVSITSAVPVDGRLVVAEVQQFADARYHIPAMYLACGLAGFGVATGLALIRRLIGRPLPVASAVAVGIVCMAAVPRLDLLWRMWTPQREFEFFRNNLTRVDPECRIVTTVRGEDAGFVPFQYLWPDMVDVADFLATPAAGACFVYYRAGNCYAVDLVPGRDRSTFQINPTCRAVEERFRLEPIAEQSLPAVPYRGEVYARNPLPVGFYRLREVEPHL